MRDVVDSDHENTGSRLAALMRDPRASEEGYATLRTGDREYAPIESLLDHLIANGTSASPTLTEKATTRYAAAYTCARVLGMLEPARGPELEHDVLPATWPYPGYDSSVKMPSELAPAGADPNSTCWGPDSCTRCENYKKGWVCTDWCAAGDHCNAYHRGCGSILTWPGHCPHQKLLGDQPAGGPKQSRA